MALEDDIRTLGATPLLDALSHDALRLLAFSADKRRLMEGDVLFREGDVADSGFVVVSGAVALTRAAGGAEKIVRAGALIGEFALLSDTVRPATATACEPAEVYRIARALFGRLLDEYPELAKTLHERLATRVRENLLDMKAAEWALRK